MTLGDAFTRYLHDAIVPFEAWLDSLSLGDVAHGVASVAGLMLVPVVILGGVAAASVGYGRLVGHLADRLGVAPVPVPEELARSFTVPPRGTKGAEVMQAIEPDDQRSFDTWPSEGPGGR